MKKTVTLKAICSITYFDKLIGAQGARLLRDRRAGETLKSETYKCGSPPAPRKASNLERKSTTFKSIKKCEKQRLKQKGGSKDAETSDF
ncbi:hypothetical protein AWM68_01000 [Fictibacillus phosphorivorans]|uniref:Uncharacterized protein n=1 Tax=Fictibacillus phosphorivorans TaxID=1221500 RepID=A0A161TRB1_9BACL|nr:hypothetical protein AWM68_01000 [Fictibacillus phosphorivorans]